jgi:WD40 repeat protein
LPERCAAIEDDYRRWKLENELKKLRSCSQHYATIDAVKLHRTLAGKKLCFSASRDHSILLWDLEKVAQNVEERDCIVAKTEEAHSGWIWGLTLQNDSTFYTSSWDGSFKQWQICESAFQVAYTLSQKSQNFIFSL